MNTMLEKVKIDHKWLKESIQPSMTRAQASEILKKKSWAHVNVALATLVDVCLDTRADPKARVAAAVSLLDRGFGKPEQLNIIQPQFEGTAGVLMIPYAPGNDEWKDQAKLHHDKMLH